MDVSIIIVNWNSNDFLRDCLRSICLHPPKLAFEVIVVDNASYDGSAAMVAKEFPNVIFIQSSANLGFSGANNLGYARSSGTTLLFLNPDTELLGNCVEEMHKHLRSSAKIGAVGCRLLNSDGSTQMKYIQAFPTIWNQFISAEVLMRRFPRAGLWGRTALCSGAATPFDVDVLAGSCIMIKKSVFEEVDGFNEGFFMYAEDVDLCYVVRNAGYSIQCVPSESIVHHSGKSSSNAAESHFSSIMQRESLERFFRQRHGRMYAALYRLSTLIMALVRLGLLGIVMLFHKTAGVKSSVNKWRRILAWSLSRAHWASTKRTATPTRTDGDTFGASQPADRAL